MDNYNTKQCNKCNEILPMDNEHFYRLKKSKDGFDYKCKKCWGKKEYGVTHSNETYRAKDGHKFCSICKKELPFSNFNKTKKIKDGHSVTCKVCSRERHKNYIKDPAAKNKRDKRFKAWRKKFY